MALVLALDTYHKIGWGSILALGILKESFYHSNLLSRSNFLLCLRVVLFIKN
ncbi:hypothetical protein RND71_011697 [Anisodus tanguticus]|uniref:Uncharacterized protein n=1 Tax=Anisodus tanguticus TaxID=243964 RepID=A0AAE1SD73_9SOLA|nr:hypothetical protein RND71_011697 [Anisodus tanguticus]